MRSLPHAVLKRSLGLQVIGVAVFMALLGGGVVGLVVIERARSFVRDDILSNSLATVDVAAALTAVYVGDAEAATRELAARPVVQAAVRAGNFGSLNADLERWIAEHPNITVFVSDLNGVTRVTGYQNKSSVGQQRADQDWFQGPLATGLPFLGAPGVSPVTNKARVPYGVPIRDDAGLITGVLTASIQLDALSSIITSIHVGQNARASLTDLQHGVILANVDQTRILTPTSGRNRAVERLRAGERGALEDRSSAGEPVLASFAPVDGLPWGVLIQQPSADAFAPVDDMAREALRLVGASMVLAVALGAALALRIARPLQRLRATADAMASGDLDRRAELDRQDEAGELGRAFDHMADRLQASIGRMNESEVVLRHQALHDELTGLPNRSLLQDLLSRAIVAARDDNTPVTLLLVDLDRFKEVNDTFGHRYGDLLLQKIAARLGGVVRAGDTVARLGGDEFGILLAGTDPQSALTVAQQLLHRLQEPFEFDGQSFEIAASIGIASFPAHGTDPATLLRQADVAMYVAKRGESGVIVYTAEQDHYSAERLALGGELRRALENSELLLHFQPKLNLRDGTLAGVEALVRWQHPQRGFLPPNEFMGLAEQTGLIYPLTRWVLEAALQQQQDWRALGLDVSVAVNLSRRTLHDPQLPDMVGQLLTRWDAAPAGLVLELTESSLMADPLRARENLAALQALGVRMSIDDFGTGYSSLASLQNLSVDELKIDRSFVHAMATDASARAIVRAIVDLADALKLDVVAEGVEDRATWELLAGLGCDMAQGYFLSRPVAPAELETWIAQVAPSWLEIAAGPNVADPLQERIRERGARLTAEEEFMARKQVEAALVATEERNRLALQAAGMGTWAWDVVRNVHSWSAETEAMSGLAPGTFDGSFATFMGAIHPDDWPAFEIEERTALAERRDSRTTYRVVRPDGSIRWLESRGRGLYAADDTLLSVTGTSLDITDRKLAEQQREAMAQSEKLRALGQMATGIAHDLNQSLMLVASYSDLARQALAQDPPNLAEIEDLLTTTGQAALDGGETVKRLLLFTRAAPEQDSQAVNLGNIVRDAAQLTAPRWRDASQAAGRPISLHVDVQGQPFVQGSPAQLRELMTNVIFNAVDALPTGGTIHLRALAENGHGIIEIADSGVGMSAEVQQRVFEPFFTTKGEAGTGLGLAMVFRIVEQHGGQIEVRSAPGDGTTFRITLPLIDESLAAAPGSDALPATQVAPVLPLRILAVDDEPMMTKAVARMLRSSGHLVSVAASGEEAIQMLDGHMFEVVLSDMGMGAGMNGWELAAAVKVRWPAVRFLLATGWGAAIDPAEARAKGVEAVLAKPYQLADLLRVLASTDRAA